MNEFRFRGILYAIFVWVFSFPAHAAWTNFSIKVVDEFNRPMPNVSVTLDALTADGSHGAGAMVHCNEYMAYLGKWAHCGTVTNVNGIASYSINDLNAYYNALGDGSVKYTNFASITRVLLAMYRPWSDTGVYSYAGADDQGSGKTMLYFYEPLYAVSPNSGSTEYTTTFVWNHKWMPSQSPSDSGSFVFAGVPYQILYDPPGDGSSASLTKTSSSSTSVTASFGTSLGASLSLGYSYENALYNSGASIDVTASVKYAYNKDNNFTATMAQTQGLTSSSQSDASIVGPGRGDVLVCPSLRMKWQLKRFPALNDPLAYADGYIYRLFYTPVADPSNTQQVITASQLPDMMRGDTATLRKIQEVSVIDPQTHRIRSNFLDANGTILNDRLVKVDDGITLSGGGTGVNRGYDSTVSKTVTVTQNFEVGTEVAAKLKVGGFTAGATLSASLAIGGVKEKNQTFSRSVSYAAVDANPWDQIRYTTYLDRTYGVYVFQVDSTQSWSSFPYETGYSSPAVQLGVKADRDTLFLVPGATDTFRLSVSNLNRSAKADLDKFAGVTIGSIVNSGAIVSSDGNTWNIDRTTVRTFKISASARDTGTYEIVVPLTAVVGGLDYTQNVPLTLIVSEPIPVKVNAQSVPVVRMVNAGGMVRVMCASDAAWKLSVRDISGRLLMTRTGTGAGAISLPVATGMLLQTLEVGGTRLQQFAVSR